MATPNVIIMDDPETERPATQDASAARVAEVAYIDMDEPPPDPEAPEGNRPGTRRDWWTAQEGEDRPENAEPVAEGREDEYPTRREDDPHWFRMEFYRGAETTEATVLSTRWMTTTGAHDEPWSRIYRNLVRFGIYVGQTISENSALPRGTRIHVLTDVDARSYGTFTIDREYMLTHAVADSETDLLTRIREDVRADDIIIQLPNPQACRASYITSPMVSSRRWTHPENREEHNSIIPYVPSGGSYPMIHFNPHQKVYQIRFASMFQLNQRYAEFERWIEQTLSGIMPSGGMGLDLIIFNLRKARVGELEESVKKCRESSEKLIKASNEEISRLTTLERTYEALKESLNAKSERDEVERMLADMMKLIPLRYKSIMLNDNGVMTAFTQKVTVDYGGQKFYIGHFRITVDLIRSKIIIKNIDSRISTLRGHYDHPHVTNGDSCWGNLQQPVFTMLKKLQLHTLMLTISNFLFSYNSASPYRKVQEGWPIYDSKIHGSLDPVEPEPETTVKATTKVEFANSSSTTGDQLVPVAVALAESTNAPF